MPFILRTLIAICMFLTPSTFAGHYKQGTKSAGWWWRDNIWELYHRPLCELSMRFLHYVHAVSLDFFSTVLCTGCPIWIGWIVDRSSYACFGCQTFFPINFMVEKCVHFDIWNKKDSKNSKGPLYELAYF